MEQIQLAIRLAHTEDSIANMRVLKIYPFCHSRPRFREGKLQRESMKQLKGLDSCFRRNDNLPGFGRNSKLSIWMPIAADRA
jgi:hypothetical protein